MAALSLVPLAAALLFGEMSIALRYGVVAGGMGLGGFGLSRLPRRDSLRENEGFAIAALLFLITPLCMTYPLSASRAPFVDVLFEAVSGVTTTGLSTLSTVAGAPETFLFARAWMQWYGGLGIVILSLALVVRAGQSAKILAVTESEPRELLGGVKHYARTVLVVYLGLTAVTVAALIFSGTEPYDALLYGLSAVSTGGFAPHDGSLLGLESTLAQAVVMAGCMAGALPLTLYRTGRQSRRALPLHALQLGAILALSLACAAILTWTMTLDGRALGPSLRHGLLLGFSAQSTAGFSSVNVGELGPLAKGGLIFSMLIGGGVGSTAGGFKVLRLLMAVKLLHGLLRRVNLSPHAFHRPSLLGQELQAKEMQEAMTVITLYATVLGFSWLAFLAYDEAPLDALFEVTSALGTVGLSTGISRPDLPAVLKGVLCADMLLGRLEIFAWLVLLSPGTWIGRRT